MAQSSAIPGNPQNNINGQVLVRGDGIPAGNNNTPTIVTNSNTGISSAVNGPLNSQSGNGTISGSNSNTIAGQTSNSLQGNAGSNYSWFDQINIGNLAGCKEPKSFALLVLSALYGGPSPGCDCWVSTGADLGILLAAGKFIVTGGSKAQTAIKFASHGRQIKEAIEAGNNRQMTSLSRQVADIITKTGGRISPTAPPGTPPVATWAKTKKVLERMLREFDRDLETIQAAAAGWLGLGALSAIVWALGLTAIYRPKVCIGSGTFLFVNDLPDRKATCNCECLPGYEPIVVTELANTLQNQVYSTAAWVFDNVAGVVLSSDEITSCCPICTGCLTRRDISLLGACSCVCDPTAQQIREYYNVHPDAASDCPFERSFNSDEDVCCCRCPEGSDVDSPDRPLGHYARITDNLGTEAPSKGHYLYQTGCSYVCDGRDQLANGATQWPPECPDGYVWDGSPYVCNCVPCPNREFYCLSSGTVDNCDNCPSGDEVNCDGTGCDVLFIFQQSDIVINTPTEQDCIDAFGMPPMAGWIGGFRCI